MSEEPVKLYYLWPKDGAWFLATDSDTEPRRIVGDDLKAALKNAKAAGFSNPIVGVSPPAWKNRMKSPTVEAVTVNYGTFTTVKKLRDELDRVLRDNSNQDVPLKPPMSETVTQRGPQFVSVTLEPASQKQ